MEGIDWLNSLNIYRSVYGLESITRLLDGLGNPQKSLRYVHVAGTNGKGSVCAMLAKVLEMQGYKVGLYTSPHIKKINERIVINSKKISDQDLDRCLLKVKQYYTDQTFFEVLTAAALLYFSMQKVDIVVLETGLGGRLDATNIVTPLISVITNISLEHTDYLGKTEKEIALEKAGIIKENVPIVTGTEGDALKTIKKIAKDKRSELILPARLPSGIQLSLNGSFQKKNAATVLSVAKRLNDLGFMISDDSIKEGISKSVWPGRFEFLEKNLIVDCAHNPAAIAALTHEINSIRSKHEKIITVFGVLKDKDYETMLDLISSFSDYIIFTRPDTERAKDPSDLLKISTIPAETVYSVNHALKKAKKLANPEDLIVVTGSFYTVGEIYNKPIFE